MSDTDDLECISNCSDAAFAQLLPLPVAFSSNGTDWSPAVQVNQKDSLLHDSDGEDPDHVVASYGVDAGERHISRAAYEALAFRLRDVETALGNANRQNRDLADRVAELEKEEAHWRRELRRRDNMIRILEERESVIAKREQDLIARERNLDSQLRQVQARRYPKRSSDEDYIEKPRRRSTQEETPRQNPSRLPRIVGARPPSPTARSYSSFA